MRHYDIKILSIDKNTTCNLQKVCYNICIDLLEKTNLECLHRHNRAEDVYYTL